MSGTAKPIWFLAAVLLLLTLGAGAHFWKRNLRVKEVVCDRNQVLTSRYLVEQSGISAGEMLYGVDLQAVRARIMKNPYIRDVAVSRDAQGRIILETEERLPIAVLLNGNPLFLDDSGFVLPATAADVTFDLPVISGDFQKKELTAGKRITDTRVLEAIRFVRVLRVSDELNRQVSEVHVRKNGDLVLYTAERGIPVIVGQGEYGRKLALFKAFWQQVVLREEPHRLRSVDLRYADQVITQWENRNTERG